MALRKEELIEKMTEKTALSKKDAEKALNAFLDATLNALKGGDSVQLIGFGTFEVTERKERSGRNPRTGETTIIAACKVPKFRPGKALRDAVK